jgi:ATP-dependent Clp protease protease subunit
MGDGSGKRTLLLEGELSQETWWGDEVTPKAFKAELAAGSGDIDVIINSPGGDVFAAAEIYDALRAYPGKVTVKISALAASAASVVAMAGDEILISPTATILIHNPSTFAFGEAGDMEKAKRLLDSIKESIINAYRQKTGISRAALAKMMDEETPMDATKAIKLGFADDLLFSVSNSMAAKLDAAMRARFAPAKPIGILADALTQRLDLLYHN